jgi:hypothetical protein
MIIVNYIKEKEYKAHYKDSSGFLVKFGPYPNQKIMNLCIKEYMNLLNKDYKIKKE